MEALTSVHNLHVRAARELAVRKGRLSQRAFLCEGEHMVGEAFAMCPEAVRSVFIQQERMNDYVGLLEAAEQAGTTIFVVAPHVLASISQVKTPQGIAAVIGLPQPVDVQERGDRLLLLEGVQDPGNVGTLLRTLDAAGFDGCLLTPDCADPYGPKALRASMGSIFRVPLYQMGGDSEKEPERTETPAEVVLRGLTKEGYCTIAAVLDGEPFYSRPSLGKKLCLAIGSEGTGLSSQAIQACTHHYKLPMRGGAESLNAAIAAAILMYDIVNR